LPVKQDEENGQASHKRLRVVPDGGGKMIETRFTDMSVEVGPRIQAYRYQVGDHDA
jgi:hypothetical protein